MYFMGHMNIVVPLNICSALLWLLWCDRQAAHHVPLKALKAVGHPVLENLHTMSIDRPGLACILQIEALSTTVNRNETRND